MSVLRLSEGETVIPGSCSRTEGEALTFENIYFMRVREKGTENPRPERPSALKCAVLGIELTASLLQTLLSPSELPWGGSGCRGQKVS